MAPWQSNSGWVAWPSSSRWPSPCWRRPRGRSWARAGTSTTRSSGSRPGAAPRTTRTAASRRSASAAATAAGDNRAEQRVENDYTSGTNQFQGEVRVVSLGGSNVSLKQTFMPNNGAFLMLAVAAPGRLYSVGDNAELAADIVGRWVRINTIHDVAAGTHEIRDRRRAEVHQAERPSGRLARQVRHLPAGQRPWPDQRRVAERPYWRGGRSPGGTPQPSPATDAGVAGDVGGSGDAIPGGEPGPDAGGTGGSEGTGGSGGSGGVAGSGGAGGGGTGGGGSGGSGAGTGGGPGTGGSGAAGSGGAAGTGGRGGSSSRPDAGAGTGGGGVERPTKATGCAFGGSRPGGIGRGVARARPDRPGRPSSRAAPLKLAASPWLRAVVRPPCENCVLECRGPGIGSDVPAKTSIPGANDPGGSP